MLCVIITDIHAASGIQKEVNNQITTSKNDLGNHPKESFDFQG